ncbi:T9SS type A sorting domain-containing protein, partial [Flavobacterium caeni]
TVGGHQITGYRIRITNGSEVQTIEKNVPHFTIPQFPSHAYATTYTVEIQLQRAGIWQASWGASCLVSTPAILVDGGAGSVNPSQCGITLASINTLIATTSLQGVTGYRFRISDLTNPTGPNAVQTIDRTQNWFSLQMLARYNYGTEYRIEVAVKTTGTFGGYGAACELSSPAAPTLVNCGGTVAAKHTPIASTSVSGATQYRFQVVRASDLASATLDRSTNFFNFNMIPVSLYTAGATYNVRVAVMTAGTCSPFGDACEIMAPGAAAKPQVVTEDSSLEAVARISAYPNPFVQDFAIESTGSTQSAMSVKVYDMLGRLVEEGQVGSESAVRFGSQYPSGVYNVIVTNGQNVKTLRMVKR